MLDSLRDRMFGARPGAEADAVKWLGSAQGLVVQSLRDKPFKTRGYYKDRWPRGAVVHYTAGWTSSSAIEAARQHGYSYFVIDQGGVIIQGAPLDRWGSHAGQSFWPGLGAAVSQHLVGIEVVSPGLLRSSPSGKLFTWWGSTWSDRDARKDSKGRWFSVFTESQESALRQLLLVLKAVRPEVFDLDLVLGHEEVSPGRKLDPGGSLNGGMALLRRDMHSLWHG